jgi:hypothetical protein
MRFRFSAAYRVYREADTGGGNGGGGNNNGGTNTEVKPVEPAKADPPANPANPDPAKVGAAKPETAKKTDLDTLPDDVRDYIKSLRDEAAKYRTDKRAAEDAKLAEEKKFSELAEKRLKELNDANAKLAAMERQTLVSSVAAKHGLPADLAARLQGETEAELTADAKKLAALIPGAKAPDTDAGKGGTGSTQDAKTDTTKKVSPSYIFDQPGGVAWPG